MVRNQVHNVYKGHIAVKIGIIMLKVQQLKQKFTRRSLTADLNWQKKEAVNWKRWSSLRNRTVANNKNTQDLGDLGTPQHAPPPPCARRKSQKALWKK